MDLKSRKPTRHLDETPALIARLVVMAYLVLSFLYIAGLNSVFLRGRRDQGAAGPVVLRKLES